MHHSITFPLYFKSQQTSTPPASGVLVKATQMPLTFESGIVPHENCFADRNELEDIINLCKNKVRCIFGIDGKGYNVGEMYGWPMDTCCVSKVMDVSSLFAGRRTSNSKIWSWDTSQVTTMEYMFSWATAFNSNLSSWNTSRVTSMFEMFSNAS